MGRGEGGGEKKGGSGGGWVSSIFICACLGFVCAAGQITKGRWEKFHGLFLFLVLGPFALLPLAVSARV